MSKDETETRQHACMIFDDRHYLEINEARWDAILPYLRLAHALGLRSSVDLGCGPGWFSSRLLAEGFSVTGLEAREEIVAEASRRVPAARFFSGNLDHPLAGDVSPGELGFCFGLLYHLENPFQAVRSLRQLTTRVALIESQLIPGDEPICRLIQESTNVNQGFTHHAVIPSLSALVKMLSVAGFTSIYEITASIAHVDFQETATRKRRRRILIASFEPLDWPNTAPLAVPSTPKHNYG